MPGRAAHSCSTVAATRRWTPAATPARARSSTPCSAGPGTPTGCNPSSFSVKDSKARCRTARGACDAIAARAGRRSAGPGPYPCRPSSDPRNSASSSEAISVCDYLPVTEESALPRPRSGQVAVVTGGSAGLGFAIARALARAGSMVLLAGRSAERSRQAADTLTAETGSPVLGYACDVTDEDALTSLVDRAVSGYGRLDALVTSAGVQARGTIDELTVSRAAGLPGSQRGRHLARLPGGRPADARRPGTAVSSPSPARSASSARPAGPGTRPARAPSSSSPAASRSSWPEPASR